MVLSILSREEKMATPLPSLFAGPATRIAPREPPLEEILTEGRRFIDPTTAARIAAEANYSRQRKLKPFRLHRHLKAVVKDQWDPDCTIRFGLLGGKLILIDGQHRIDVVVQTGRTLPFIVVITPFNSEAELHTAYSRIDADGNRSVVDVLAAAGPTDGRDISFEMRRHAYFAMDALANDFPHRKLKVGENDLVSKEDRIVCLQYWLDQIEAYDAIVRDGQPNLRIRLRRPGIVAVALATLKHQRERAECFWGAVANNDLLKAGDPEQAMVSFLLTASLNDGFRIAERGAAQAWNAWFNGRRLHSIKKSGDTTRPILIAGTPFQGFKGAA